MVMSAVSWADTEFVFPSVVAGEDRTCSMQSQANDAPGLIPFWPFYFRHAPFSCVCAQLSNLEIQQLVQRVMPLA